MTSKDLKIVYLKDTGKAMYNHEIRPVEQLLEYIEWLEEKVLILNDQLKVINEITENTTKVLKLHLKIQMKK
jgi:hypothetical protein